ncbi:hypothetical protein SLA2020_489400 [Shorea laevis]
MAQSGGEHPRTTPTATPTKEQLLRAVDSQKWSPQGSPSFRDQDSEDNNGNHHLKKSVLTKVKEKARKLRKSLSKKKHSDVDDSTPSPGVRFEDLVADEEENPEYLGAPMYESELAPERYKATAMQSPRELTVIPENHALPGHTNLDTEQEKDQKPPGQNKTLAEATTEPVADTIHDIATKIHTGLTVSVGGPAPNAAHGTDKEATEESSKCATASDRNEEAQKKLDKANSSKEKIWDKGVSVKEYIMNKFEPGEDEKALSQVISQAMSPRSPSDVVGKVKEAMNSFLWSEKPAQSNDNISRSASNSLTNIPVSTNAEEVMEEESHGRILQTN